MRWFVVGALAACGTTPVGKVSVTVYSNAAASGDAYVPAKPIAGVMVFEEDGAQATTDAAGVAELAIDHDPATVHVVAGGLVTIVGVPNGGNVRLGNRPYFPAVGLMTIDVDGTNDFAVATPGCLSFHGGAGSGIEVSFDGACAGQTVRVVATSAQLAPAQGVAQDIVVALGTVTLGPLSAATTYAPQPVNVPASLGSPAVAVGTVGPGNLAVIFPTLVGPADATRVVLTSSGQQGPALETSTVVVDGPVGSTVDASHMLPIPHIETADADGAAWSIPASRAQPNLVEVDATYGELQWTIFAPTSATRVSLPALPMSVALTRPIAPPSKTVLRYFEMPRAVLTVDELAGSWDGLTAPRRADHQPIAVSSTASF